MSHVFKAVEHFGESFFGFKGIKSYERAIGLSGLNGVKSAAGYGQATPGKQVDTTPPLPDYNALQQNQQAAINAMRLRSGRLSTILSQPSDQLGA